MRTLLLIGFLSIFTYSYPASAQSPEGTGITIYYDHDNNDTTFTVLTDILCSPAKDTIFIVKGEMSARILEVWNQPSYKDEKPVFIYVTPVEMTRLRYAGKSTY